MELTPEEENLLTEIVVFIPAITIVEGEEIVVPWLIKNWYNIADYTYTPKEEIGEEVVSIILPSKVSFQPTLRRQTIKQEKKNKEERNKLKLSKKDLFDAKGKGKEKKDGTSRDRGICISDDKEEEEEPGQGDDLSDSDPSSSDNESDNDSENSLGEYRKKKI